MHAAAKRSNASSKRDHRPGALRSEEHTSELQSQSNLVCRLLLEKKKRCSRRPSRRLAEKIAENRSAGPGSSARPPKRKLGSGEMALRAPIHREKQMSPSTPRRST